MQDGARPYRKTEVFYYVNEYFNDHYCHFNVNCLILFQAYRNDIHWPPNSPDLTTYNFSLSRVSDYHRVQPFSTNIAEMK